MLLAVQGTAATEALEFSEVYGLEVVRVPTNRPSRRRDLGAYLFLDSAAKYDQLVYLVSARRHKPKNAHRRSDDAKLRDPGTDSSVGTAAEV